MPRGVILNFTYNSEHDHAQDIPAGTAGTRFPRFTVAAKHLKRGDVIALFPHPVTHTRVLAPWNYMGHCITTRDGRFDTLPTSQITIVKLKRS